MVGDGFGGRLWYKPYGIATGSYSGFAVCDQDNQLYSWGYNAHGELGTGNTTPSDIPVKVIGVNDVYFYSTGYLSGAIRGDQSAWVWGLPYDSVAFKLMDDVRHICAGINSISLVKLDGTVWHLGNNLTGQFGNGEWGGDTMVIAPQKMDSITDAVRVANGFYSTAVLVENGDVYAAGRNYRGGLGQPESVIDSKHPMKIEGLKNIIDIKATAFGFAALDKDGDVYSWGEWNEDVKIFTPRKLPGLSDVVSISGKNDGWHFMAVTNNKECYTWGRNQYQQMGTNDASTLKFDPYLVATDVVEALAGETFSYLIKSDGKMYGTGQSKEVGSIWMNLEDKRRFGFVEMDYEGAPMNLCKARRRTHVLIDTLICENENLKLFGKTYTSSGRYFEVRSAGACDSVIIIDVRKGITSIVNQSIQLCGNESYAIGGNVYSSPGTYRDTLVSLSGCDSIVNTTITKGEPSSYSQSITLCHGEILTIGSVWHTESGVYIDTIVNSQGCDSIITTNLVVLPEDLQIISYDLCSGDSVEVMSNWYTETITLYDSSTNINGCDSVIQYSVSVHNQAYTKDSFTFCPWDPFVANGRTFYEIGTYRDTLQTSWGCDSITVVSIDTFQDMTCYPASWIAPEAFTPNGDNLNEIFRIKGIALEKVDLLIFNRWGEKLYDGDGYQTGWDGKYQGQDCQQDVYMYIAYIKTIHRERAMMKGTLTLLR